MLHEVLSLCLHGLEKRGLHLNRDGLGMKLAQQAGMKVIIITGRKSNIVEKRMSDNQTAKY
jgi:3-deoxy-D-manno-octulosonate 8-phosphate phosphatase KdsC-like HAD superfamily phosphatase